MPVHSELGQKSWLDPRKAFPLSALLTPRVPRLPALLPLLSRMGSVCHLWETSCQWHLDTPPFFFIIRNTHDYNFSILSLKTRCIKFSLQCFEPKAVFLTIGNWLPLHLYVLGHCLAFTNFGTALSPGISISLELDLRLNSWLREKGFQNFSRFSVYTRDESPSGSPDSWCSRPWLWPLHISGPCFS